MAYTPVGWQTGDTITADRLNRMDRGWGFEETELFSETVTTVDQDGVYEAELAYAQLIDADPITVTFDGTEYVCSRIDGDAAYYYGGFAQEGPDFTEYPFFIISETDSNLVFTSAAGEHTMAVSIESLQVSSDFEAAVTSCIEWPDALPFLVVNIKNGLTNKTWNEIRSAFIDGICIVSGYGPVLQMWYDNSTTRYYMATGNVASGNGAFDPYIWRTSGSSADLSLDGYKPNSQMP